MAYPSPPLPSWFAIKAWRRRVRHVELTKVFKNNFSTKTRGLLITIVCSSPQTPFLSHSPCMYIAELGNKSIETNVQFVVRGSVIRGGPNPLLPPKMIRGSRITYPITPPPPLPSKMIHHFPDHPCRHVIHQFVINKNDPTGSNNNT